MSKKVSIIGLFTAFAVVLSYIESFIPSLGIPGVKLGLANFAIVLALYVLGNKSAVTINIVRIVIVGAMFGSLFSIYFSIVGAVSSYIIMCLLKMTKKLSIVTVAIAGGVFHNIGQLLVAGIIVDTYEIVYYVPVLIVSGIITGAVIGLLVNIIYRRTKNYLKI